MGRSIFLLLVLTLFSANTAAPQIAVKPERVIDPEQVQCLAANIYHEARGESLKGKFAVGHVTLNRVKSTLFPDSICGVVYQAEYKKNGLPKKYRCQFSWYCDGMSDTIFAGDAWKDCFEVASTLINREIQDITHGSTHYYNGKLANPRWAKAYSFVAQIDNHTFHKMEGVL